MKDPIETRDRPLAGQQALTTSVVDKSVEDIRVNSPLFEKPSQEVPNPSLASQAFSSFERRHIHFKEASCNDEIEPCLAVVIPVYNEAETVSDVIKTGTASTPG